MIRLGGYIRNPVLVQVIGICPIAAAATSLMNSLLLSLVFAFSLILSEVIASALLKKFSRWVRMGVYAIIGVAAVFPVMYLLEKSGAAVFSSLGIYLPLMAMSSLVCVHCEKYAVKHSVKLSFFDAVASSVGYCAVLLVVGAVREIIGSGSILGFDIPFITGLKGALMPFFGFLMIGVLAAVHKAAIIKKYGKKAKDLEERFPLDEERDEEATFIYAVKNRFKKNKTN